MRPLFETVTDFQSNAEILRVRRYGVIEIAAGRLVGVHLHPLPKLLAWPDLFPVGEHYHSSGPNDLCRLFYNQPRRFTSFIAVKYAVSTIGTSISTIRSALTVLDAIARIKRTDALLCDVANTRIPDRLLARWGWTAHKPQRFHRNFIKRFYGHYPDVDLPARHDG